MGIWRNIGKIVSLSCEIILLEVEWYLFGVHKKSSKKEKHDTHNNKVNSMNGEHSGVGSNYEPLNEEEESRERSNLMVELCEQPHLPISDREIK